MYNGIEIKDGPDGLRTLLDADWRYSVDARGERIPTMFDRMDDEEEEMYIALGPTIGLAIGEGTRFLLFKEKTDAEAFIQSLWDAVPEKTKTRVASQWLDAFDFLRIDAETNAAKKAKDRARKEAELKQYRRELRETRRLIKELKAELENESEST